MKMVTVFHLILLTILTFSAYVLAEMSDRSISSATRLCAACVVAGGFGGCLYCLRAIYLNCCVKQQWNESWLPWYYIRPFASMICGGLAYLFLTAGLLLLGAERQISSANYGFYALAFVAGMNVDGFLCRVEAIAHDLWGIKKSRVHRDDANNENE